MQIIPTDGIIATSPSVINIDAEEIEDAVVLDDIDPDNHPNFIESNTSAVTLEELTKKCIVPTFADNTLTISHTAFIKSVIEAGRTVLGELTPVEIRASHQINGRIPSALHKKTSELRDNEKTIYYQRMAFVCHVAGLTRFINGQPVHLCIGGVRAYNEDKLFGRESPMKFKIFVGWQVRVCSNLCLTCDGFTGNFDALTASDIKERALQLFSGFDPHKDENLRTLEALGNTRITEEQFCGIIGRLRLYQALPTATRNELGLPEDMSRTPTSRRRTTSIPSPYGNFSSFSMRLLNRLTSTSGWSATKTALTLPLESRTPLTGPIPPTTGSFRKTNHFT